MRILPDLLIFDVDLVFAKILNEKCLFGEVPVNLGVAFTQCGALLGKKEIGGIVEVPFLSADIETNLAVILCSDEVLPSVLSDELTECRWGVRARRKGN